MHPLRPEIHAARRQRLLKMIGAPILLIGNGPRPRNLPGYGLPFRQDSSFLYFTGCTLPDTAALLTESGQTLFLQPPAADDDLWHGHSEPIEQTAAAIGFSRARPIDTLEAECAPLKNALRTLAVSDHNATRRAAAIVGRPTLFLGSDNGHEAIVSAVIELRRRLAPEEIAAMRQTAVATDCAHRAAMAITRPGGHEREVSTIFDAVLAAHGAGTAYDSIVTVRGEILHNFHYTNRLESGQLLLLDGGGEGPSGYANDVTRTWPVSGTFTPRQRATYDAVLAAQQAGIDRIRPGARYRDIHMASARVLATFLHDEGLLTVDADTALETGAHALFFPHGVGHLIGLDVHDLEAFGDRAHYAPGRSRSEQFGTAYLRLDLDLEEGMVVTIEPGIYIVPAILNNPDLTERFAGQVDLERARSWIGFGGIRIEDDVATTADGPDVLTAMIPKSVAAVEAAAQRDFRWEDFTPR
jgi:Xaa-Pro aminopeptidase